MSEFIIATDSAADMVPGYAEAHNLVELELTYTMDDVTRSCNDPSLSRQGFFDLLRQGKRATTAAVNVDDADVLLRPVLESGKDVLFLAFSSGLSSTCDNITIAAKELAEEFPERKIIVIDTLCASGGQALIVDYAVRYKDEGHTIDEVADLVRDYAPRIAHLVAVDDLMHLLRGGRVSKTSAYVGSVLGIKPIIHVNDEGKLISIDKIRGRKQSLLSIVDRMEKQLDRDLYDRFFITHSDCLEDAQFVAQEVIKRFGISEHSIGYIGPVIGAHTGPGTIALFFLAKHR